MKRSWIAGGMLAVLAVFLLPSAVEAQFFLRGEFNGYDTSLQMTDLGGGVYEATASGLTAGQKYRFLAANADFSIQSGAPFEDVAAYANSNGEITARFYSNPSVDGWEPGTLRLGLLNLDYTYELMGSFNGFSAPLALVDNGGLLEGSLALDAATSYSFVFRALNDWNMTIKSNFGDSGADIGFTTGAAGVYNVQLDLTNGRYRFFQAIPEPSLAGLALLGLAGMTLARRRRG